MIVVDMGMSTEAKNAKTTGAFSVLLFNQALEVIG
jgi:hypothetical protein